MKKVLASSVSFCKYSLMNEPGDILRNAGIQVDMNQAGKSLTEAELLSTISQYDAIIAGTEPITANVIGQGKNLKIIAKNGVGFDNIDLKAATENGIFVTITPGAVEQTVADSTFALILSLTCNITKGDTALHKGEWPRLVGTSICGKKLGVIGLGRIGKNVVIRSAGFGMDVYAYDPQPDTEFANRHNVKLVDLDSLLGICDIVSIHAPKANTTHHLINREKLALMKPNAVLINTSRGGLVDEGALVEALQEKKIAGAALDVFEKEPLMKDSPLLALDNVVLTPHLAGLSSDALLASGKMIAENIIATFSSEIPQNIVNRDLIEKLGYQ